MSILVIGALNVDLVARVPRLPRPGETVLASALSRHVGGKGGNQAVAAARAGSAVRLVSRVGGDEGGRWLLEYLQTAGIDTRAVGCDEEAPTGQAFITLCDAAENAIVVMPGANARLTLSGKPAELLAGARVLLAQLETALGPVSELFAAQAPGCLKVLNAAPALPAGAVLFPQCDVIVLNETELAHYVSPRRIDSADIAGAARTLIGGPRQSVVVTLGARGVAVVRGAGATFIAARPVMVVDTVGAGDCFCGVLAAALDQGLTLEAAAARANIAASLAVGRRGAAEAMPSGADIDAVQAAHR